MPSAPGQNRDSRWRVRGGYKKKLTQEWLGNIELPRLSLPFIHEARNKSDCFHLVALMCLTEIDVRLFAAFLSSKSRGRKVFRPVTVAQRVIFFKGCLINEPSYFPDNEWHSFFFHGALALLITCAFLKGFCRSANVRASRQIKVKAIGTCWFYLF